MNEGNLEGIERTMKRLKRLSDVMMRGPFMEEFGFAGKESQMFAMEFPMMIERTLMRTLEKEMKKAHSPARRKLQKSQQESEPGESECARRIIV